MEYGTAQVAKTLNTRESTHGSFKTTSRFSQELKFTIRKSPNWDIFSNEMKESLDMIAVKIARILNTSGLEIDHWHDIAGYATLVEQSLTKSKEQFKKIE